MCRPHLILLLLPFLPHPSVALPPDDFQLFAAIFFVLLAVGLILSVAFASAMYFFLWYGRKKEGQKEGNGHSMENVDSRPIQWITTSYRGAAENEWNAKAIPTDHIYSPYPYGEIESRGNAADKKNAALKLFERFEDLFADLVEAIGRGWRKLVSNLPGPRSSSPSQTIFPASAITPPPSYISAQSPELAHFANWAIPPPPPLPPPSDKGGGRKQPKGILKKPKMRSNGNGLGTASAMPRPIRLAIQQGTAGDLGRQPPPIPRQWKWNAQFEGAGPCERIVEDRMEREESCYKGKLVAVERVCRTTTTTKMLQEEEEEERQRRGNHQRHWPSSTLDKTIFI